MKGWHNYFHLSLKIHLWFLVKWKRHLENVSGLRVKPAPGLPTGGELSLYPQIRVVFWECQGSHTNLVQDADQRAHLPLRRKKECVWPTLHPSDPAHRGSLGTVTQRTSAGPPTRHSPIHFCTPAATQDLVLKMFLFLICPQYLPSVGQRCATRWQKPSSHLCASLP